MKRRLVSLLLVASMAVGLFVGCTKQEEKSNEKTSEVKVEKTDSEEKTQEEESLEPVTIKVLARKLNDATQDELTETWPTWRSGEVLVKELEELGITLEIEWVSFDSFENVVNTRVGAGVDLPDIIAMSDKGLVDDWGKNGLVYSVADLLEQYDEDGSIKAFYDEYAPGCWGNSKANDGNVYGFASLSNSAFSRINTANGEPVCDAITMGMQIRKDFVEAVGEEVKDAYTLKEFTDLCQKIRDNDANGNGKNDEIIYLDLGCMANGISRMFGLNSSWDNLSGYRVDEDIVGAYVNDKNFPAYIEYLQSLYESGLFDTEILSTSLADMVSQDRVIAYFTATVNHFDGNVVNRDENKVYYMDIILDDDGDLSNGFPMDSEPGVATTSYSYCVPSSCKQPEAVVRLMDYVYTEEYGRLSQFGAEAAGEGEPGGFYYDESGIPIKIATGEKMDFYSLQNINITPYVLPHINVLSSGAYMYYKAEDGWSQEIIDRSIFKVDFRSYYNVAKENKQLCFTSGLYDSATEEEYDYLSSVSDTLKTYCSELITDLVLGRKSLDDLATYQAELNKIGLDKYVQIMQDRHDRYINR